MNSNEGAAFNWSKSLLALPSNSTGIFLAFLLFSPSKMSSAVLLAKFRIILISYISYR